MQKNKSRILIVTDFFYPHWTGIAKSLWYLQQSLKKYSLSVLTVKHLSALSSFEHIENIDIYRVSPTVRFSRTFISLFFIPRYLSLIFSHDIVLINSPCTYILPTSLIAKLLGKKLLVFHQGDLNLPQNPMNKIIEKIFDISSFVSLYFADKVSSYTQDYANHSRVLKPFLSKFYPLLMPIPHSKKAPHLPKMLGNMKQFEKYMPLFGFAGRFVEEKGFDILLRAIPSLIQVFPHAHFVFAGETEMRYEHFFEKKIDLFERVKTRVSLLGVLDEKSLANFYQSIDLFIVPSRSDCFNLTQAESMIYGTPVIVSDIPGLREVVNKTGFGSVFEKNNPEDLAQSIIKTVRKKDEIMNKKQSVYGFFNRQKIITAWEDFLYK